MSNHNYPVHLDASFRRLSLTPQKQIRQKPIEIPPSTTKRDLKVQYNNYVSKAKQIEKMTADIENNFEKLEECYLLYSSAFALFSQDEKLKKKLAKLKSVLDEYEDATDDDDKEQGFEDKMVVSTAPKPSAPVTRHVSNRENDDFLLDMRNYKKAPPPVQTDGRQLNSKKYSASSVVSLPRTTNNQSTNRPSEKKFIAQPNGFVHDSERDCYCLPDSTKPFNTSNITKESLPYCLASDIYKELYDYQRDSIKWFWKKHCEGQKRKSTNGGILGDDMGLGKTVQVAAYLAGLFQSNLAEHVMIGMPVSVLQNWRKEFLKWAPDIPVYFFHNLTKKQREYILEDFCDSGGILLTTYGMITSQVDLFVKSFDKLGFNFDYIFLDEGHRVKNPSIQLSQCLRRIPVHICKFILTGTPIQNNLMEIWALFDYLFDGRLLGSSRAFKSEFEKKIIRANEKDASDFEKRLGHQISLKLQKLIEPHLLRREKSVVLNASSSISISRKNDLVIWIKNSEKQQEIYNEFLTSPEVRAVLNRSQSVLSALTTLKQICSHPNLLKNGTKASKLADIIQQSGKLTFLEILLKQLYSEKRRVLIFSQSVQMLYLISKVLDSHCFKHLQIDGSISDSRERQKLIDEFNEPNSKYFCFLLTSQVGGFGITLTSADRVVIFEPAWNPSVDSQAVDRAYRIGQTKDVIVYRLISCGTIEEKIYRKQVFKGSLSKQTIEKSNQHRYFTHSELRELFTMGESDRSETQHQLREIHQPVEYYEEMKRHIKTLETITARTMVGYSDHDVLFSNNNEVIEDDDLSLQEAEQSQNRLFSPQSKSSVIHLSSPPPNRTRKPKGTTPASSVRSNKFTENELPNLLKGVRMYGEEDKWGLIALDFFSHTNISSHNLEKAWMQFKQGKTIEEIAKLICQFDDSFDILPALPTLTEVSRIDRHSIRRQSIRNRLSSAILIDDDEPAKPEAIKSVCRRVSMGLGLIDGPYSDDEEDEDNDNGDDCINDLASESEESDDDDHNDSFIVPDGENMSDGDYESPSDLEFIDDRDMDMATISTKKVRKHVVDDSDEDDEAMKTVERPSHRASSSRVEDFQIIPFSDRLSTLTEDPNTVQEQDENAVIGEDPLTPNQTLSDPYVQLLYKARDAELQNNIPQALSLYMQALEISDQDNKLHCKICVLAKVLQFY